MIPLKVVARERGGGSGVARLPSGRRALARLRRRPLARGAGGASQALEQLMRNLGPVTVSACLRVKLAGPRQADSASATPTSTPSRPLDDILRAPSLVDAFDLPAPRIERARSRIRARRGREVRRADLGAGAAPRGGRQAGAHTGDGAAPPRRAQRRSPCPCGSRRDLRSRPPDHRAVGHGRRRPRAEDAFLLAFVDEFSDSGGEPSSRARSASWRTGWPRSTGTRG